MHLLNCDIAPALASLLPRSQLIERGDGKWIELERNGWEGCFAEFADRPFPAEDVTESCTLSPSCFVPVEFVSKKENDYGLEMVVRCWKHVAFIKQAAGKPEESGLSDVSRCARSRRMLPGGPMRCAGSGCYTKSSLNGCFRARLQRCLEPTCARRYEASGCEHHRCDIVATRRREVPTLWCMKCGPDRFRAEKVPSSQLTSIGPELWARLWSLEVTIYLNNTQAQPLQKETFDVRRSRLSDLLLRVDANNVSFVGLACEMPPQRRNLLDADPGMLLEDVFGSQDKTVIAVQSTALLAPGVSLLWNFAAGCPEREIPPEDRKPCAGMQRLSSGAAQVQGAAGAARDKVAARKRHSTRLVRGGGGGKRLCAKGGKVRERRERVESQDLGADMIMIEDSDDGEGPHMVVMVEDGIKEARMEARMVKDGSKEEEVLNGEHRDQTTCTQNDVFNCYTLSTDKGEISQH
jgi:hypothetical protein